MSWLKFTQQVLLPFHNQFLPELIKTRHLATEPSVYGLLLKRMLCWSCRVPTETQLGGANTWSGADAAHMEEATKNQPLKPLRTFCSFWKFYYVLEKKFSVFASAGDFVACADRTSQTFSADVWNMILAEGTVFVWRSQQRLSHPDTEQTQLKSRHVTLTHPTPSMMIHRFC